MKKNLFFAVMVLVALASCSGNDLASETAAQIAANDGNAIVFNTSSNSITRADYIGSDAAAKLHYNFVVEGVKVSGATSTVVFDHYNVNWVDNSARTTLSNTNNWEYVSQPKHAYGPSGAQVMKYWDFLERMTIPRFSLQKLTLVRRMVLTLIMMAKLTRAHTLSRVRHLNFLSAISQIW